VVSSANGSQTDHGSVITKIANEVETAVSLADVSLFRTNFLAIRVG
jgi:hypothetical protein